MRKENPKKSKSDSIFLLFVFSLLLLLRFVFFWLFHTSYLLTLPIYQFTTLDYHHTLYSCARVRRNHSLHFFQPVVGSTEQKEVIYYDISPRRKRSGNGNYLSLTLQKRKVWYSFFRINLYFCTNQAKVHCASFLLFVYKPSLYSLIGVLFRLSSGGN